MGGHGRPTRLIGEPADVWRAKDITALVQSIGSQVKEAAMPIRKPEKLKQKNICRVQVHAVAGQIQT